jgi:hypothetical protein
MKERVAQGSDDLDGAAKSRLGALMAERVSVIEEG